MSGEPGIWQKKPAGFFPCTDCEMDFDIPFRNGCQHYVVFRAPNRRLLVVREVRQAYCHCPASDVDTESPGRLSGVDGLCGGPSLFAIQFMDAFFAVADAMGCVKHRAHAIRRFFELS